MKSSSALVLLIFSSLAAACAQDPALSDDAGVASSAPILKAGVDPAIFLPTVVAGYHPTQEELAASGRACVGDTDCATGGQVVFHCSTPYYGQAQCQGTFPPGDQVVPGTSPSCAYYDCPTGFECETEAESHSVTCLADQHKGADAGHGGRGGGTP